MGDMDARLLELQAAAIESIQEAGRLELQVCDDITKRTAELLALTEELPPDDREGRSISSVLQVLDGISRACRHARHQADRSLADIVRAGDRDTGEE